MEVTVDLEVEDQLAADLYVEGFEEAVGLGADRGGACVQVQVDLLPGWGDS